MKLDNSNPAAVTSATSNADAKPGVCFAGFWRRFAAALIDGCVVLGAVVPFSVVLTWVMDAAYADLRMKRGHAIYLAGLSAVFAWVLADWLYHAQMISGPRQATVGKRMMGLRVTGSRGRRVKFAQASARHFAKFLSAFIGFAGFIMAAFTRKHQALHDVVADTIVIEDPVSEVSKAAEVSKV